MEGFKQGPLPGSWIMSNDEYHADITHLSSSGVKLMHQSPLHFHAAYLHPKRPAKKSTPAQQTGTVVHAAILEAESFEGDYLAMPSYDLKTKAGRQSAEDFRSNNPDKIIILSSDREIALRCRDSAWAHPKAKEILGKGFGELSFFATDPETGAKIKVRPDWFNDEMRLVLDVKTCEDASEVQFGKDAANYEYDIAAAMYPEAISLASNGLMKPFGFVWLACEKKFPYAVSVQYATPRIVEMGMLKFKSGSALWKSCMDKGTDQEHWPGYSERITPAKFPAWAFKGWMPEAEQSLIK